MLVGRSAPLAFLDPSELGWPCAHSGPLRPSCAITAMPRSATTSRFEASAQLFLTKVAAIRLRVGLRTRRASS